MGSLTGGNPFAKHQVVPARAGTTWPGLTIGWQYELERGLRKKWPGDVQVNAALRWVWSTEPPTRATILDRGDLPVLARVVTYHHRGLPVLGRPDPVPVRVEFHQYPTYDCYGLSWQDYPRVFADPGALSLHRMPTDGALCLYYPWDPPERRWRYENGLVQLYDVIADHLYKELWWRHTGGHKGGEWPGEDAEHGEPVGYERRTIGGIAL